MKTFMMILGIFMLLVLAYDQGYRISIKAMKYYVRKETGRILTQFGDAPTEHESQQIVKELMDFLYEYTDGCDK